MHAGIPKSLLPALASKARLGKRGFAIPDANVSVDSRINISETGYQFCRCFAQCRRADIQP